ncbi:Cyclase family protein isoform 1 [Hibiscus syriacus]|uniref:Cyclase family protein isoform 1 n=1 Tax=Hibiscus syriacus TaxID=106335 RepID=A0A6A3CFS2_HIBSY|nr:Cyclase family protein isoform 1 [Hibiscus syriacus]
MKSLKIPRGVHRVLFKTLNTDRRLMHRKKFASDFTGLKKDGHSGLDYLSVSAYDDAAPTHHIFLRNREIVLVEGLNLDGIKPGKYTVHCLPTRMVGADGCPTRCILTA